MIEQAVIAGLLASGCQPIEVGICPIPSFLFLTKDIKAAGGDRRHGQPQSQGMERAEIHQPRRAVSHAASDRGISRHLPSGRVHARPSPSATKPSKPNPAPTEPHLKKLLGHFDVDLIRRRKFKVAVDCGNGAGATLMPRLLDELGCETVLINAVPDGSFAHNPEPLPENIREICRTVVRSKADVGFVQDADADRLAIVNEKGLPLGEEMTLALAAQYVLGRKKGRSSATSRRRGPSTTSPRLRKAPVFRTKIGEINVVEKILSAEPPAAIAGEGNGGVILPDIHPCRDSFTAICLILEAMARSGKIDLRPASRRPKLRHDQGQDRRLGRTGLPPDRTA